MAPGDLTKQDGRLHTAVTYAAAAHAQTATAELNGPGLRDGPGTTPEPNKSHLLSNFLSSRLDIPLKGILVSIFIDRYADAN